MELKGMSNFTKSILAATAITGVCLASTAAYATTLSVNANVTFVDTITIAENNALNYGLINTTMVAGDTVAIDTADTVADSGSRVVGGTQQAADLTVTATVGQSTNIMVNNVVNGTGYSLATWRCKYDVGAETACDGTGMNVTSVASGTLKVGATLTGNGSDVAGPANGSFDVVIAYN
jgi:hypothetical protein